MNPRFLFGVAAATLLFTAGQAVAQTPDAATVHTRALVLDSHADILRPSTPARYYLPGGGSRADLDHLTRGDVDAVVFSLAVGPVPRDAAGVQAARAEVDAKLVKISAMAEARVEGRYADQSEAGRVNLAVATAEGTRARLEGDLEEALGRYALLVDEPAAGLRLPSVPPTVLKSVAEEGALEAAIAGSPLYRKAALGVRVAEAGVREANAARFPRLNLEGGVQRREIGGRLVNDSSIGVRFRLASQQGLSAQQRPELERQRREAALWAAEAEARELKRTVGALVRSDVALADRIAALSDQGAQAEAVRDLYGEQFLVGRRDIQDLVIMQAEQFEAERQKVDLVIERLRLQYRAAAQLGLLTPMMTGDQMQSPGENP